jgi:diphosphomevalonate decarboxylase
MRPGNCCEIMERATAIAHPNLALVKYWGKVDETLNLPANSSISISLGGATTVTSVQFKADLMGDQVLVNGQPADLDTSQRVSRHLDEIRALAGIELRAEIESTNDFPMAAGMASSASAFAALSLAGAQAAGLELDRTQLSILARHGSGSACRSIYGGYVEWLQGESDATSYALPLAAADHWDLRVITVIVTRKPKTISSSAGHRAAWSSPFFGARLERVGETLALVREAILARDFPQLALTVEREAISMHAVAMTGQLPGAEWLSGLYYWEPATLALIHAVQGWRRQGVPVFLTIDAGPNVHLICERPALDAIENRLAPLLDELGATALVSPPGREARLV